MTSDVALADVLSRMGDLLDIMEAERDPMRHFLGTYARTTRAVADAVGEARFEDPDWVIRWDAAFADLYVDALTSHRRGAAAPWPWRLAFGARADLPPLAQVLLGINAHINYDLPQALLAVISDADFADPRLLARRQRDHSRIDGVLARRVGAEDHELRNDESTVLTLADRALTPLNRAASRRFLREAREKVWHNARELQVARLSGGRTYEVRLRELEVLSAARIADLLRPGQVLLRLAVVGFGVTLPPRV